ncbi:hypothetical protein DFH07DRAFT_784256 [Mycena maculata]|uniref:Uncharacterized protein n=1 Tax=Mycena maculata TaxID=230809 RepID=A0AAD7HIW0_9AGAR|nr:hypothetical protein DFH07DRAFT_784256 [Mycena maculata]
MGQRAGSMDINRVWSDAQQLYTLINERGEIHRVFGRAWPNGLPACRSLNLAVRALMAWAWAGLGLSSATLHVLTVENVHIATFQDTISIPFPHHSLQDVPANPIAVIDGDYEGRTAEFKSHSSGFLCPFMRGFVHYNYTTSIPSSPARIHFQGQAQLPKPKPESAMFFEFGFGLGHLLGGDFSLIQLPTPFTPIRLQIMSQARSIFRLPRANGLGKPSNGLAAEKVALLQN